MADKDLEGDGPSLELPSFGLGRKKSVKQTKQTEPAVEPELAPAPVPTPAPTPAPTSAPTPAPVAPELDPVAPVITSEPAIAPDLGADATDPRPKREFSLPALAPLRAALVVGAVIGLLAVILTFASLKLCELVRGTDSCGGPGLLLLVATLVILTYVGGWLLRGFAIDDPGSTSFLAVGLLAVIAMLFFLDVIYNWWMVIVIPIVAMATYALSWWVTTRFVDID
ncbi:hypothetical protein [Nocardioides sp.]|uniref:hypothetical protein n=1 Tax=Nocardioides sp. TaxID=35761 RepID=UPI00286DE062|nr:hypothetical protein [Nocardioides sp.]